MALAVRECVIDLRDYSRVDLRCTQVRSVSRGKPESDISAGSDMFARAADISSGCHRLLHALNAGRKPSVRPRTLPEGARGDDSEIVPDLRRLPHG